MAKRKDFDYEDGAGVLENLDVRPNVVTVAGGKIVVCLDDHTVVTSNSMGVFVERCSDLPSDHMFYKKA